MDDNIFDKINNTLTIIDNLSIEPKFKGKQLFASEFNDVVNKINEIQEYLNTSNKNVILDTTSYILDKIERTKNNLVASNIKMSDDSTKTIFDEINEIQNNLSIIGNKTSDNESNISNINSAIDNISESLGFIREDIQTTYISAKSYADEVSETAYTYAVEESKKYTNESYTKLYTHINDTTLTFDYDIKTEPEPDTKTIYDNDNDLYDGEYHD